MKIALTLLAILVLVGSSSAQEVFSSPRWGFEMQSPRKWLPMTKQERADNAGKFEVSEDALARILESDKGATFIQGFYKYDPQTTSGLIPTIQIEARRKPPVDFGTFKSQIIKNSASLKTVFPDIAFAEFEEVEISGIRSVLARATLTMTTADGQILRSRSTIYSVPLKNFYFQLTFNDGQDKEFDCTEEFLQLRNSIKIKVR